MAPILFPIFLGFFCPRKNGPSPFFQPVFGFSAPPKIAQAPKRVPFFFPGVSQHLGFQDLGLSGFTFSGEDVSRYPGEDEGIAKLGVEWLFSRRPLQKWRLSKRKKEYCLGRKNERAGTSKLLAVLSFLKSCNSEPEENTLLHARTHATLNQLLGTLLNPFPNHRNRS